MVASGVRSRQLHFALLLSVAASSGFPMHVLMTFDLAEELSGTYNFYQSILIA